MRETNWELTKSKLNVGNVVAVRITHCEPFGLLVVGDCFSWGVIERIGMEKAGYSLVNFEVGATVDAIVIGFRDWSNQVELQLPSRIFHMDG